MRAAAARSDVLVLPVDEPLLFVGPPGSVRGRLQLQNTGEARMSLRGATVRAQGLPAAQAPFVAVLPPGARATASAVLGVDATTAPGTYAGQVDLGGELRAARVVVLASTDVELAPARVVVQQRTSEVTAVVRNVGNVDVSFAELVRAGLRRNGGTDDERDEPLLIGRLREPSRLAPGRSAVLELTVELPENLDPTRRYVGDLPVGPAVLTVVVPPGAPALPPASSAPRSSPAPARKRAATGRSARVTRRST